MKKRQRRKNQKKNLPIYADGTDLLTMDLYLKIKPSASLKWVLENRFLDDKGNEQVKCQ